MRRYQYPFIGKRYLLNTNTGEVHDLDNESPYCRINEIKLDHIVMFDDVQTALRYPLLFVKVNGCRWCLQQFHTN